MDELRKIIIPMIRKILPSTIAQEIVNVQPMNIPAGSLPIGGKIGNVKTGEDFDVEAQKVLFYWVEMPIEMSMTKELSLSEIRIAWCKEQFGKHDVEDGKWHKGGNVYYFSNEQDRTLFVLRWA